MNETPRRTSPYQGLIPYSEPDAPFFFGRESDREIITANLMASRLTLLYGTSGVGKSSVLRAGVAHHLKQLARQNLTTRGAPEFVMVVFSSWRDDPVLDLATRVRDCVAELLGGSPVAPAPPSRNLAQALEAWTEQVGDLLVILDQFEEYFLYHAREDGEGTFAVEFPRAVNRPDLRVNFLVSLREDSLAKLDRFKGRIPNLFDNYLRIEHLDHDGGRAAIEKPLEKYNALFAADGRRVSIEPAAVEAILQQVKTGRVALEHTGRGTVAEAAGTKPAHAQIETPYLQLVLTRLWVEERRAGSTTLRLETLKRLGGAQRIVRTHLDTALGELPVHEQEVAARIFRHLVTPSGSKIAHTLADLAEYAKLPRAEVAPVLEKLSHQSIRILRPIAPPPSQSSSVRYEIFHDVLARAILDWWQRHEQQQAQAEVRREEEERRQHERAEAQRQRELEQARRLRWGIAALTAALLVVGGLAGLAFQQRSAAVRAQVEAEEERDRATDALKATELAQHAEKKQRKIARSNQIAAGASLQLQTTGDAELSVLLAIEAANRFPTEQAEDALREALLELRVRAVMQGHSAEVTRAAFSPDPDGSWVVTASNDGTARIWHSSTGKLLATLDAHTGPVNVATFSPDSKWLVTAGVDRKVCVWETGTWSRRSTLEGHTGEVYSAMFSPDSRRIVTGGEDTTARLWRTDTGELLQTLRGHMHDVDPESDGRTRGYVSSVAFSPDGNRIMTASFDGTARFWNAETGESVGATLKGHTGPITSAAFSPDGRRVVTTSLDQTARLWDVNSGELRLTLPHANPVSSAAFSSDGVRVVTASLDTIARVWNLEDGKPVALLRGHAGAVSGAAFSPDGKRVVTAAEDGTARVWDTATGRAVATLRGHKGQVYSAAFSPDGKSVITASGDKTARLWQPVPGKIVTELRGHADRVNSAVFSSDGKWIVTASADTTAAVWNAVTGERVANVDQHKGSVTRATFSRDGQRVVTASFDKTALVWDRETSRLIAKLAEHTGPVNGAAFSPDGTLVVTADWESPDRQIKAISDNTARVWDVTRERDVTLRRSLFVLKHDGPVNTASFSSDGKRIVTASGDRTAKVWNVKTGENVSKLTGHAGPVNMAAFSSDGKRVVTASADASARVWEAETGECRSVLQGHEGPVNTAYFSADGNWIVTASGDKTARVWQASTGKAVTQLQGHTLGVVMASFSPDAKLVVTAGDTTARVWDRHSGNLLAKLRGHAGGVTSAEFSPDGKSVVTAGVDGTALVHEHAVDAVGITLDDLLKLARERVPRELTADERAQYFPAGEN